MAAKLQFETVADQVDIELLWRALAKDKIEVIQKAAPGIIEEGQIIDGGEVGLGSLLYFSFGPAMAGVEPFKERVVEFDESRHQLSFLCLEGGYLKLGLTHYVVSIKLDDAGGGKTLITTTFAYDLEQNFDGAKLLDRIALILHQYVDGVISYLQKNTA